MPDTNVPAWVVAYGSILFLGLPLLCYIAQGFLVYRPMGRIGLTMCMVGYAFALVGQYIDNEEQKALSCQEKSK